MERFLKCLESQDLRRLSGEGVVTLDDSSTGLLSVAVNPTQLDVVVTARDRAAKMIVLRGEGSQILNIKVEQGARLNLVEVLMDGAESSVVISQQSSSIVQATLLEVEASSANYRVELNGSGADVEINMLQLASGDDKLNIDLRIAHQSADCTSRSMSKCVAAANAKGIFKGLIYVAQDAQRTIAEQNSRNILLSQTAHITAEPQLEIYADDVKCSHGATVGQMDKEAILYMRQRGLSEEQARKLQLDGFISDVTLRCAIEELRESLSELIREQLEKL